MLSLIYHLSLQSNKKNKNLNVVLLERRRTVRTGRRIGDLIAAGRRRRLVDQRPHNVIGEFLDQSQCLVLGHVQQRRRQKQTERIELVRRLVRLVRPQMRLPDAAAATVMMIAVVAVVVVAEGELLMMVHAAAVAGARGKVVVTRHLEFAAVHFRHRIIVRIVAALQAVDVAQQQIVAAGRWPNVGHGAVVSAAGG